MIKNERGSTLALCVIIMCIISIFSASICGILINSRRMKLEELSKESGFYLSDSCISITEARLQTKVINTIIDVLDNIDGDEVSLTYNNGTMVYDKAAFHRRYIRYAAKAFSATTATNASQTLARDHLKFSTDPNELGDESISSLAMTSALAKGPAEGYTIETMIDGGKNVNTNYDNFYSLVDTYYPAPTYDTDNYVWIVDDLDEDEKAELDEAVSKLNTGLLRVTYTVRNKENKIVEKVRTTYTFDLFHAFMSIAEEQSKRIYPETLPEGETPAPVEPFDVDLNIKVSREYLPPTE